MTEHNIHEQRKQVSANIDKLQRELLEQQKKYNELTIQMLSVSEQLTYEMRQATIGTL